MEKETRFWTFFTSTALVVLMVLYAYDSGFFESESTPSPVETNGDLKTNETLYSTANDPDPLSNECLDHSGLERHDHVTLEIYIDGQQRTVDANIGIQTELCNGNENNMHAVHTHDTSGRLHIELNEVGDVQLGVFFDIWGVHFDETGIFDHRTNSTHEMAMYVYQSNQVASEENRIESFDNYLLDNGETVEIHYRPKVV